MDGYFFESAYSMIILKSKLYHHRLTYHKAIPTLHWPGPDTCETHAYLGQHYSPFI